MFSSTDSNQMVNVQCFVKNEGRFHIRNLWRRLTEFKNEILFPLKLEVNTCYVFFSISSQSYSFLPPSTKQKTFFFETRPYFHNSGVKGAVIGVDLGTTNSCVAVMEGKAAKVNERFQEILKNIQKMFLAQKMFHAMF